MMGTAIQKSIILIDKPKGPTSFDVVERVSRILGVRKAGHSGTLDPNATGLMLIALGEARKAMPVLMGLDKEYEGIMRVHREVDPGSLESVMRSFVGEIVQTPPVRSAVARRPRKRQVHEIVIIGTRGKDVSFRVLCQAGTYIRKIAHDAGESMGTGAHLLELRRTSIGPFGISEAVTLRDLDGITDEKLHRILIPLETALERLKLPKVVIKDEYEASIRNGSPVRMEFLRKGVEGLGENAYLGVFNEAGSIVCLARFVGSGGTVAKTDRVFLA